MGGAGIRVEDEWLQEGAYVHEVGANTLRVWQVKNLQRTFLNRDTERCTFDAVCAVTGTVLQQHVRRHSEPKPGGWRVIVEMEAIGLCAMTPDEYRVWQKAWYQSQGAWYHRPDPPPTR